MLKEDLNKQYLSRLQVKGQRYMLIWWPRHLNGRNFVHLGIIKMKQKTQI